MGGRVGLFSTLVARLATCSGFMKDKGVRSAQTLSSDDLARIPVRVAWWGPVSYQHRPIHDFPCAWFFGILGPVSYQHRPIYDFPCGAWFCGIFGPASCQHLIHDFSCASYWDIVNLSRTEGKREIFYLSIIARFFLLSCILSIIIDKRLYFCSANGCISSLRWFVFLPLLVWTLVTAGRRGGPERGPRLPEVASCDQCGPGLM